MFPMVIDLLVFHTNLKKGGRFCSADIRAFKDWLLPELDLLDSFEGFFLNTWL
jgi:hypothetical protein